MRTSLLILCFCAVMLTSAQHAQAQLAVAIDDLSTQGIDIVVEDGSAFDIDPNGVGSVDFCIAQGTLAACIEGNSKPMSGSESNPALSLRIDYIEYSETVRIMVSDTGFDVGAGSGTTTVSGDFYTGDLLIASGFGANNGELFTRSDRINQTAPVAAPNVQFYREDTGPSQPADTMTLVVEMTAQDDGVNATFIFAELVVNAESDQVPVPDVVSQPLQAAEAAIQGAGLTVGGVNEASSNMVPAGSVISQTPTGGTLVQPGSSVALVVSTGPDSERMPIPTPAGLSGVWFDPDLQGEGYSISVSETGLLMYYYGSNAAGNRLWLISDFYDGEFFFGESFEVGMSTGDGGTFAEPNPDIRPWGSAILTFDSCTSARMRLSGEDGVKDLNLIPLVRIAGLQCDQE